MEGNHMKGAKYIAATKETALTILVDILYL